MQTGLLCGLCAAPGISLRFNLFGRMRRDAKICRDHRKFTVAVCQAEMLSPIRWA